VRFSLSGWSAFAGLELRHSGPCRASIGTRRASNIHDEQLGPSPRPAPHTPIPIPLTHQHGQRLPPVAGLFSCASPLFRAGAGLDARIAGFEQALEAGQDQRPAYETISMNREPGFPLSWMIVSLTDLPVGSSSQVSPRDLTSPWFLKVVCSIRCRIPIGRS